ncbi:MAG: hemerythrin domain-containing protein [Deltaproteobacteria bacterium]|nr:hemerythrin domain-containing protein [Deltaproteobacteria bacterium]
MAALVARIIDRHHAYARRALPPLGPLVAKVAEVHGEHEPRLAEVRRLFDEMAARLLARLDEEESSTFPLLMARGSDPAGVAAAVARMTAGEEALRDDLARLAELTDGFTPPGWACRSYRLALAQLEELADDLRRHLELEGGDLLPRFAGRP